MEQCRAKVERTDGGKDAARLSIRALSALYAGYLSTRELAEAGLMDRPDDELSDLFAGPPPFMQDHF